MRGFRGATLCLALSAAALDAQRSTPRCDPDNGGLTLPRGFCATVFADRVGITRHLVVLPSGTVIVATQNPDGVSRIPREAPDKIRSVILVLRDTNSDGRWDVEDRTPINGRTGIVASRTHLYASDSAFVLRFRLRPDGTGILPGADTIVRDMPDDIGHRTKSLALDDAGGLFVSVGSRSNVCRRTRTEQAPDPCPELPVRSGIWRYDASRVGQVHPRDGQRWATGVRNAMGLAWHPTVRAVFATSHGRDNVSLFPQYYSVAQNAEIPTEEFFRVDRGADIGWPYCFHDGVASQKILAPEYGGDGKIVGRCAAATMPLIGFPAHWGPNDLMIYSGTQFPARYRNGAFIAFHGSWNRMPLPEAGYKVVFAPFNAAGPTGAWEDFADGFAAGNLEPITARHRPTGLAQGPDGSLYICDDMVGRIWLVRYVGG